MMCSQFKRRRRVRENEKIQHFHRKSKSHSEHFLFPIFRFSFPLHSLIPPSTKFKSMNTLNTTHTSSSLSSIFSFPSTSSSSVHVDPHIHRTRSIAYISIHNSCGWKLIASIVPPRPTQFNFQIPLFYPFLFPVSHTPLVLTLPSSLTHSLPPRCTRDSSMYL